MWQVGLSLKNSVSEDLAWLVQRRDKHEFENQDDTIVKAEDYVMCFGEDRMKELSRQYLQPESTGHCSTVTKSSCVMKDVGVPISDDTTTGNPARRWNCSVR